MLHQFSLFCVSLVALRARVPIVLFLSLDALVHVFLVGFQSLEIGKVSPTNLGSQSRKVSSAPHPQDDGWTIWETEHANWQKRTSLLGRT